jgi:TPR repeat protein
LLLLLRLSETPKVATPDPAALFKRAQGYLNLNDFNTARLLLTRASEEGHADATFALAEMYDPAKKRLPGITPDGSLARALYEKAAKLRR